MVKMLKIWLCVPSVGLSFALSGINNPPEVDAAISFTLTNTLFDKGIKLPSIAMPSSLFALACVKI